MQAQIIDGKQLAKKIRTELALEVEGFAKQGKNLGLAVVLIGDDPASKLYVNNKKKACKEVGINSREYKLPANTTQAELLAVIDELNDDETIHGILVQLPLPQGLSEQAVIERIDPQKDVDGFHPINVGRLAIGQKGFTSCTPAGIMRMLAEIGYDISGKKAVILGRSNIVGKPIARLLLQQNATVTICHSRTKDIKEESQQADILIAAVGSPELVRGDWIKPGAVVIDVGINRLSGKTVGDVAFAEAINVASWITPVPGGVGPMTIAMLLDNTVSTLR